MERAQLILKSPFGDLIQKALGSSPVLVLIATKAVSSLELIGCDQPSFIIGDKLSEYSFIYIYAYVYISIYICIYKTESFCCIEEINTTL